MSRSFKEMEKAKAKKTGPKGRGYIPDLSEPEPYSGAKVQELASVGWTLEEIAAKYRTSRDQLAKNCMRDYERGRLIMCGSLRRRQFEIAMEGNPTVLIFLGKVLLNQKDKENVDFGNLTDQELVALTKARLAQEFAGQLPSPHDDAIDVEATSALESKEEIGRG